MLVKNRPDSLSSNIDYSWWECFGWGSRPDLSQLELLLPGFNIFQLPRPWCLEDVKELTWKDLLVLILQMFPPRFPNLCTEFVSFLKAGWPFSTEQIGDSTARLLRFDTWSQCSLCDMLCCACDGEIPEVDKCKDPRHLVRLRTQKGGGELPLLDHSCLVKKCLEFHFLQSNWEQERGHYHLALIEVMKVPWLLLLCCIWQCATVITETCLSTSYMVRMEVVDGLETIESV